MRAALFLASPVGRGVRIVGGVALALVAMPLAFALRIGDVAAFLLFMLGAEVAVGGILNVCILCPLRGLPFEGHRLTSATAPR